MSVSVNMEERLHLNTASLSQATGTSPELINRMARRLDYMMMYASKSRLGNVSTSAKIIRADPIESTRAVSAQVASCSLAGCSSKLLSLEMLCERRVKLTRNAAWPRCTTRALPQTRPKSIVKLLILQNHQNEGSDFFNHLGSSGYIRRLTGIGPFQPLAPVHGCE